MPVVAVTARAEFGQLALGRLLLLLLLLLLLFLFLFAAAGVAAASSGSWRRKGRWRLRSVSFGGGRLVMIVGCVWG